MKHKSMLVRLSVALSAGACLCVAPSNAAETFSTRISESVNGALASLTNNKAGIRVRAYEKMLSVSLLSPSDAVSMDSAIRDSIVEATVDSGCIKASLNRLSELPVDTVDPSGTASIEARYIKDNNLTADDLSTYKKYRDQYLAEIARLSKLPKDQADAKSYKLKQITADWEVFGKRQEFQKLEDELHNKIKSTSAVDVPNLRALIYDAEGKIRYRLSVPTSLWASFNSWVVLRHRGPSPSSGVVAGSAISLGGLQLDPEGCAVAQCDEIPAELIKDSGTTVSLLAPQIDFPWFSKFQAANARLSNPTDCSRGLRPDRLLVVRDVGTSVDWENSEKLLSLLVPKKSLRLADYQFSGVPDFGYPLSSAPRFADGFLISPYYYAIGFTTSPTVKQ